MGQKLKHLWRLLRIAWILSRWDALFPFRAQGTRHRASCRTFLFFANLVPRKRGLGGRGQRVVGTLHVLGSSVIKLGYALSTR